MKPSISSLLKIDKTKVVEDEGIVYLLEMTIEGKKYVKVGVTTRDIEVRMCELAVSCWKQYRYMPHIYSKRHRKTKGIFQKEAEILQALKEYRAEPDKTVQGHSEMHAIDLGYAVQVYESVLKGSWDVDKGSSYCDQCGCQQLFKHQTEGTEVYTCGNKCNIKEKE